MECCLEAVRRLVEADLLENGAIVITESGTEDINTDELSCFEVQKSTHYGKKTFVNILVYKKDE